MPLSDRQIRNTKQSDMPYRLADGGNLYLLVKPKGGKYWRLDYAIHGKRKTLAIGTYPAISLVEARKAREAAKKQIANGIDPATAKREEKHLKAAAMANSFENIAREWHKNNTPHWKADHAKRVLHSLEVDVFSAIGKYPITDIKAPLLLDVIRKIEARGVTETTSQVLQWIKSVFNYAIHTRRVVDNPASP